MLTQRKPSQIYHGPNKINQILAKCGVPFPESVKSYRVSFLVPYSQCLFKFVPNYGATAASGRCRRPGPGRLPETDRWRVDSFPSCASDAEWRDRPVTHEVIDVRTDSRILHIPRTQLSTQHSTYSGEDVCHPRSKNLVWLVLHKIC